MAKRCQVCDGPVKDNRCTLCGMLYRRDEELYHLNENRVTHLQHASDRAKKILRQQEIPLPDRHGQQDYSQENLEAEQKIGEVLRKEALNQKQRMNLMFEEQRNRLMPAKAQKTSSSSNVQTTQIKSLAFMNKKPDFADEKKNQKDSKQALGLKIFIVAAILFIAAESMTFWSYNSAKNTFNKETTWDDVDEAEAIWYEEGDYKTLEEALSEKKDNEFLENFYMFPAEAEAMTAGKKAAAVLRTDTYEDALPSGYYMAVMKKGSGILHISGNYGSSESYISEDNNYLVFELMEGEKIEIKDPESKDAVMNIYVMEE